MTPQITYILMKPQTWEARCCNRILGSIPRRMGLRSKWVRLSSIALLLACSWVGSPAVLYAANYYVNGACALNGNGTSAGCASAAGGTGAWNGFSGISAGAGGDVIHIRGGTYSNEQDYYNFPAGVNGVAGNPLIVRTTPAKTSLSKAAQTFVRAYGQRPGVAYTNAPAVNVPPREALCFRWPRGTSEQGRQPKKCSIYRCPVIATPRCPPDSCDTELKGRYVCIFRTGPVRLHRSISVSTCTTRGCC